MADKKKFKDTTVGKLLFGAASVVSPQLGAVLNGVTSPKDAIAELDSVNSIDFQINALWNDTFEKVMMAVVISYFGSRGIEKSVNIIKK